MRALLTIVLLLSAEIACAAGRFTGPIVVGDSWVSNDQDWPGYTVSVSWSEYFHEGKNGEWRSASPLSPRGGMVTKIDDYLNMHTSADSVILIGGVNDFNGGASASVVQLALTDIVHAIKARDHIRNMIIMGPGPFHGRWTWEQSEQTQLEMYLAWLPGFCAAEEIICYDTYTAVGDPLDPTRIAAEYDEDGLHVNEAGAIHIAMDIDQLIWESRSKVTTAAIQILPWSQVADVKPASQNPLSVAVYSTTLADFGAEHFDPQGIDPASLRLGAGATSLFEPWVIDIDGDQRLDRVFWFNTADTGILCGDTEVTLTGETYDGEQFVATDSILTTDCEDTGCHP